MPLPGSHYSPGTTHSTPFPMSDPQLPFNDPDKCPGFQETVVSTVHVNSDWLFPKIQPNLLPGLCIDTWWGQISTPMDRFAKRTCVFYFICRTCCTAEALAESHQEGLDLHPAPTLPPGTWAHSGGGRVTFSPPSGREAEFLLPCQHHPENS